MASLSTTISPPTTTGIATSTTSISPSLHKISQISTITKRTTKPYLSRRLSCNANNNHKHNLNPTNDVASHPKIDRRNVLIGLGGVGSLAGLRADPFALADPIEAPDLSSCSAANSTSDNCCPPFSTNIVDFKLPPPGSRVRVRPPAHALDNAYIEKFNRAMDIMKKLPADDPISFKQQSSVHCAYCDGAYEQVGFPNLEIDVHGSWLFFPFHRWYLYFFERILGKLVDDPNFAMPYWNWDAPAGMQIPAIYTDPRSPLYDQLRNRNHGPPALLDLDFNGIDESISNQALIQQNLTTMYRQMVTNGRRTSSFLGQPYSKGNSPTGMGSLENFPHGPVHMWTGTNSAPWENMGSLYSAGRDPIFYAHHSNVDRLWNVWRTLGGQDYTDRDFLDASFLFYDENRQLVRVKVRDCLDTRRLGYVYQDVDIPWLNSRPTPRRSAVDRLNRALGRIGVARAADEYPRASFPLTLDKQVKTLVSRPKKSRSKKEKDEEDEVLVVQDIEFDRNQPIKFDVFINDEDDAPTGPDKSEFAGSFVSVPHKHKGRTRTNTCLRLNITDLLEDLDAEGDENVVVTLVPKIGTGHISIGGLKIEYVS